MPDILITVVSGETTELGLSIPGVQGPAGLGVPIGGTVGQLIVKQSATNYDTAWSATLSGITINSSIASGLTIAGALVVPLASAATPSLTFTGDLDSGVFSPGANQVAVATNGTGRLFVDASGNVKIGSTDNSTVATTYVAIGNPGITPGGIQLWSTTAGNSYIQFGDGTSTTDQYRGYLGYVHSSDSLVFGTSTAERLRITSAGLVGIGTSSPGSLLHLETASTGSSTESLRIVGGERTNALFATGFRVYTESTATNSNRHLRLICNGSTGFSIQPYETSSGNAAADRNLLLCPVAGKVGIGTTSPDENLTISSSAAATTVVGIDAFSGQASKLQFKRANTNRFNIECDTSDNLKFYSDASAAERARIDSSGRLLVGASVDSGGALLQVNGNRIRIATAKTPSSAADTGTAGEICWDADYIYVCTATNTWKRTAISTW